MSYPLSNDNAQVVSTFFGMFAYNAYNTAVGIRNVINEG